MAKAEITAECVELAKKIREFIPESVLDKDDDSIHEIIIEMIDTIAPDMMEAENNNDELKLAFFMNKFIRMSIFLIPIASFIMARVATKGGHSQLTMAQSFIHTINDTGRIVVDTSEKIIEEKKLKNLILNPETNQNEYKH